MSAPAPMPAEVAGRVRGAGTVAGARLHPGSAVAAGLALLVGVSLLALLGAAREGEGLLGIGPYLTRVLAFSLAQAAASTLLSLVIGVALALALARRRFPGRTLALAALGAAAVMPALVVVFSVLAVYGRAGWLAAALRLLGLPAEISVLGWPGILIAHVFLNAPLVARIVVDALAATPAEHWRLAGSLSFGPAAVFRHLDLPVLRAVLPGLSGVVFLLCFTSFAIVLALGGGPARATLEVAIFEALRSEFDVARAAWLAFVQIAICGAVAALLTGLVSPSPAGRTSRLDTPRADAASPALRLLDGAILALSALALGPLLLSVLSGLPALPAVLDRDLAGAVLTSLAVAGASATIACGLAVAIALAARHERLVRRRPLGAALHDLLPTLLLAVPPFALAAGLFLVLRRAADPGMIGVLLLPLINALGALPLAYRFLAPPLLLAAERYGRLADHLGLRGLARLRLVDRPALARPLAAAFALAAALSFGDFGIVALFGGTGLRTLPYLLYERLGAYRFEEAAALSLVLVATALALAYASARWSDADR